MFGLFKKKDVAVRQLKYDRENEKPVIKASICNGEKVAGFKNKRTGKFREQFFVRNEAEIEQFAKMCGVERDQIGKEY